MCHARVSPAGTAGPGAQARGRPDTYGRGQRINPDRVLMDAAFLRGASGSGQLAREDLGSLRSSLVSTRCSAKPQAIFAIGMDTSLPYGLLTLRTSGRPVYLQWPGSCCYAVFSPRRPAATCTPSELLPIFRPLDSTVPYGRLCARNPRTLCPLVHTRDLVFEGASHCNVKSGPVRTYL